MAKKYVCFPKQFILRITTNPSGEFHIIGYSFFSNQFFDCILIGFASCSS